jgi:hypothetical protein
MYQVQEQELHVNEEQEDHHGAPGVEEILSKMPDPHAAQGDSLNEKLQASSSNW